MIAVNLVQEPKICLITGATSGIGLATARALAAQGATVILHGRTEASALEAARHLARDVSPGRIETIAADLGSLEAVRALAHEMEARFSRLDVLLHNAGLERWQRRLTVDGFEETFAVNHLAPFLLTRLLIPLLTRGAPARVLFVSSVVHGWGKVHWGDLSAEKWFSPEPVYYQSKLASALTAMEFARRLEPLGVTVNLCPPGLTRTRFGRDFRGLAALWTRVAGRFLFRAPDSVAHDFAELALGPRCAGVTGAYLERGRVGLAAPRALVRTDQRRMWMRTSELTLLTADDPGVYHRAPRGQPRASPPKLAHYTVAVTCGELLGFTLTAAVAFAAMQALGRPETWVGRSVALAIMTFAGALEGASLGYFQWRSLRTFLPELGGRAWVTTTAAVAGGGWFLGMLVPLIIHMASTTSPQAASTRPGPLVILLLAAVFGAAAGLLFGGAQWLVLRRHVMRGGFWVAGNTLGWAIGLPFAYAAGMLGTESMRLSVALGLAASAALLMGISVAIVTGLSLRRVEPRGSL